jgi:hypothetical protein
MDYGNTVIQAMRIVAVFFIAEILFAQDPVEVLAKARDKILSELPNQPNYTCVETIDRSYLSRSDPPSSPLSCERLSVDRKKGRDKLKLASTDRLRVEVALIDGREIYSWTGPGTFSQSVEEILQFGPAGTGAFGAHLIEIFGNPSVRFRLLEETGDALEYGFRVPIEASRLVVKAGMDWRPAGYDGSFTIDRTSEEMRRFTMDSDELPPETSICEANITNEYPSPKTGSLLLPHVSRSHNILRDATETESVSTFSNCRESIVASSRNGANGDTVLPKGISFELALAAPIDSNSAAAGDVISAALTKPILWPKSATLLAPAGSKVIGRIIRMEHYLAPKEFFLVSMAFDTLQADDKVFRFHARSAGTAGSAWIGQHPDNWPMGNFLFPTEGARLVIPSGYISKWVSVVLGSSR